MQNRVSEISDQINPLGRTGGHKTPKIRMFLKIRALVAIGFSSICIREHDIMLDIMTEWYSIVFSSQSSSWEGAAEGRSPEFWKRKDLTTDFLET